MTNFIFIILPYITIPLYIYFEDNLKLGHFFKRYYGLLLALFISTVLLPLFSSDNLEYYALFIILPLIIALTSLHYLQVHRRDGFSFFHLITCLFIVGKGFLFLSEILTKTYVVNLLNLDREFIYWLFFSIGSVTMIGLIIEGILCLIMLAYKVYINLKKVNKK